MNRFFSSLSTPIGVILSFFRQPLLFQRFLNKVPSIMRGFVFSQKWKSFASSKSSSTDILTGKTPNGSNPLRAYFDAHTEGKGIWKWGHYFDIYHSHFNKFVGKEVHILEIGVYSGGSLLMWREYFGSGCRVYGVDLEGACKAHENSFTKIFIGDQADRGFWKHFRQQVPELDIIIDDGGHLPEQQIVTLEELLPTLRSGGVYVCEDIHGSRNPFASYVHGLSCNLNEFQGRPTTSREMLCSVISTPVQSMIHSVHLYPFVTVIEKTAKPTSELLSIKHGTQWGPRKVT